MTLSEKGDTAVRLKLTAILLLITGIAGYVLFTSRHSQATAQAGPASLQEVEGFNAILHAPNKTHGIRNRPITYDHLGPAPGYWTAAWWVPAELQKNELIWETASCPEKKDTAFSFIGVSASTPPEFARGPQARLSLNDQYALTFDLGIKSDRTWKEGDFELRYQAKRVQWPYDGYHRQFEMNGNSGIYRLTVPARVVQSGKPCRVKVEVLPFPRWPRTWFMIKDHKDTLKDQHLDQEVDQLRSEVNRLKELVHILATEQYPDHLGRTGFKHQVVYTNGYRHLHPADIVGLRNGEWLLSFREATEHLSLDGDIAILRSRDEGRTWRKYQKVAAIPDLDEREGCMLELPDGRLMMNVYVDRFYDKEGRYLSWPAFTRDHQYQRMYTIFSKDHGKTWTSPVYLDTSQWPFTDVEGPAAPPILLPDGTILMMMTAYNFKDDQKNMASVILSSRDGLQWDFRSVVAEDPGGTLGNFVEGAIVRTRSGRLIAAMRNHGPDQFIWTALSRDDGKTWSQAKPSPMVGHPPELIELSTGAVLCTYGCRPGRHGDPGGIRSMLSYDEGETWDADNEIIIRQDFTNMDIGYPMSLQRKDGKIVTVYYYNLFDRFYLGTTVWDLPAK